MSVVSLLGVKVLNNPASFNTPYEFEITFECLEQLRNGKDVEACTEASNSTVRSSQLTNTDLEWKLVYVGSATS